MQITDWKNIWKGKRCFIFGNGKSMREVDMSYFWFSFTFGTNRIDLLPYEPNYYVVEDELVIHDNYQDIQRMISTKFIPNRYKSFFGDDEKIVYYEENFEIMNPPRWTDGNVLHGGGTVTYQCLQIAYIMGFKEVYLLGVDHDYVMPDSAIRLWDKAYESQDFDPNHFHPNYFGRGRKFHDPDMPRMERAYQKAKEVFEADGRKIYNAGIGGNLEVFERVDYRRLF